MKQEHQDLFIDLLLEKIKGLESHIEVLVNVKEHYIKPLESQISKLQKENDELKINLSSSNEKNLDSQFKKLDSKLEVIQLNKELSIKDFIIERLKVKFENYPDICEAIYVEGVEFECVTSKSIHIIPEQFKIYHLQNTVFIKFDGLTLHLCYMNNPPTYAKIISI